MPGENRYISMQEIQLFMLDRFPEDNFLLDDREFGDEQFAMAMRLTIDRYNSTTPIGVDTQSVETFPWRLEYTLGVASVLLRMRALNMMRNNLSWNTGGGIAVDDKSSYKDYIQMSKSLQDEFDDRVKKIKQTINIEGGYGALGSEYQFTAYGTR